MMKANGAPDGTDSLDALHHEVIRESDCLMRPVDPVVRVGVECGFSFGSY